MGYESNRPIGTTRSSELESGGDGRNRTREAAEQVRETAQDLKGQAKQKARAKGEEQKARATDEIQMLATALHEAGSKLDREEMASGGFIHAAADRLDDLSTRLDRRDIDGLIREGRQWARRHPTAFLGSAVAAGFLASRFLKASADDSEWDDDSHSEITSGRPGYESGVGAGRSMTAPETTRPRTTTPAMGSLADNERRP
ncbi:MAG: hypothetical protein KY459_01320 [Acidobacteria bacterium]|nr:hypothetical protein [Acidobacteriota bacterium]